MTRLDITRALQLEGWERAESWINGTASLKSEDGELVLDLRRDGSWTLGKFTDSDVDTESGPVAMGRYRDIADGEDLDEVLDAVKAEMAGGAK